MKQVKYFYLKDSPYCRKADRYIASLCSLEPRYADVPLERIEASEQPELAARYGCNAVPAFYVDGSKLHEGAATLEMVKSVLDAAMR